MQNHQQPSQEPPPPAGKPPRPLTISVSRPSNSTPDHPTRPNPKTHPDLDLDQPERSDSPSPDNKQPHRPPTAPTPPSPTSKNGGAIVAVENYYSPLSSPLPVTPPNDAHTTAANNNSSNSNHISRPHQIVRFNTKEEAPAAPHFGGTGEKKREARPGFGYGGGLEENDFKVRPSSKKGDVVKKIALGIRFLEIAFCLVSFCVMATDRTEGWSGDSFGRYNEFRFCLTVNVIGFAYAAIDLAFHLASGKHGINSQWRYQFDFIMDQIVAYLLISASSSAATRVADWELNWGKDEFTKKATASISMAFIAFLAFAMSSLISGYQLCTRDV